MVCVVFVFLFLLLVALLFVLFFFFSSRRRHTRCSRDWSSDVCSSDLHARHRGARSLGRLAIDAIDARAGTGVSEGAFAGSWPSGMSSAIAPAAGPRPALRCCSARTAVGRGADSSSSTHLSQVVAAAVALTEAGEPCEATAA